MGEKLTHSMTAQTPDGFGYDPKAEWKHSEEWLHDSTPGSWYSPKIQKWHEYLKKAISAGVPDNKESIRKVLGPGIYPATLDYLRNSLEQSSPERQESYRLGGEEYVRQGMELNENWSKAIGEKGTAHPGGYEIKKWVEQPGRDPSYSRRTDGGYQSGYIEAEGMSPKWNDPMLGPGQIPPGAPGANNELLPDETEEEYIRRVVWPMYGGRNQIAWEDLPGVHAWSSNKSPWYDPRVPWPSNVPRSPSSPYWDHKNQNETSGDYDRGFVPGHTPADKKVQEAYEKGGGYPYGINPASDIMLPELPEGAHRYSQPGPILRQERGSKQPWSDRWARDLGE